MTLNLGLLPDHKNIRPKEIKADVERLLKENRLELEAILDSSTNQVTWENLVDRVENLEVRLSNFWAPISHLNAVVNTDEMRRAHDSSLEELTLYGTELLQSKPLYERFNSLTQARNFEQLDLARQRLLTERVKAFERSGVSLPKKERSRFKILSSELSQLASEFNNNVLDATDAWFKHIQDELEVTGLPAANLEIARNLASEKGLEGVVLNLDMPCYMNVMTHCRNRALREEMYEAYISRASEVGPQGGRFDNTKIIESVISKRHELAQLVGFANFADYSIDTKMVDSADHAKGFLEDLLGRALPQAQRELSAMKEFARSEFEYEDLEPWDSMFVAERLREHSYSVSDEELRPYFPIERVIAGMFEIVSQLYGIQIESVEPVAPWHEDVRMYEVFKDYERIAIFYLDPFARSRKRGGAWMADCRNRRETGNQLQLPVAYLTCNFTPPTESKPSLLTHSEVVTLFHESGHGLHHMLTKQRFASIAGINGVEWDAVELPSQFMENWCWQPKSVAEISGHHETGKPLPEDLLAKLIAGKNFNSAVKTVRQLEFGLFDLDLHMRQPSDADPGLIWEETKSRSGLFPTKEYDRFPWAFGHIFGGGYAAGYYSYLWAEVLSADAFAAFEEEGLESKETGERFLKCILEAGGSRPAAELFESFRGRKPRLEALLRHSGIQPSTH